MGGSHQSRAPTTSEAQEQTVQDLNAPATRGAQPVPVSGLTVGRVDDPAEHAADALAETALARLRRFGIPDRGPAATDAHRHDATCGHLRRAWTPAPSSGQVGPAGGTLDHATSARIEAQAGTGAPLPTPVRRQMEAAFGTSLGHVRVHDGPDAARLAAAVSAQAFTTGRDVFFGAGQFDPDHPVGERILAHEIAHVLTEPTGTGSARPATSSVHRAWAGTSPAARPLVVVRRTRLDYEEGYAKGYTQGDMAFWEGLESGLDELVDDKVLTRDQAEQAQQTHRLVIRHLPGWDAEFNPRHSGTRHYQLGFDVGAGAGFDHGYEEALATYGYSRKYSAIPGQHINLALQDNNGRCVYCNRTRIGDIDHIEPLKIHWQTKGSTMSQYARSNEVNDLRNLVGACATCNRSKGSKKLISGWQPPAWGPGQWWPFGPPRVAGFNRPPPYSW